jgi:predicted O-methyltransferase YrrM
LWSGYESLPDIGGRSYRGVKRSSDEVRTSSAMGRFFAWLVTDRRPAVVVEFGTAFGVSGMFWLSGLERNGAGRLLTFEPNEVWADIARRNLAAVSRRFELTVGTFEENIDRVLAPGERIDVAFIDAIHTSAFVEPQFEAVAARLAGGGLVLLDDIDFSADMRSCWERIRDDRRLAASVEVDRVGIVEFRR